MMNIPRIFRHLLSTDWQLRRVFPKPALQRIEQEIKSSEAAHGGEIRFAVENALSGVQLYTGQPARERAIDVFSQLRMWDTEQRNGVLIYLLLADRSVEIIADRGVAGVAPAAQWEGICQQMEQAFRAGRFEQGALEGVRAVHRILRQNYPGDGVARNELSNAVVLL